jgi:hypothetical protein
MNEGEIHIYNPMDEQKVWPHPCPNCNSATYLGIFIPTVEAYYAEWHGWSFQCKNQSCDPIYEKHEISWDENGEDCEPYIYYDLVAFGAYWDNEDDCYYTPQCPRL